ncbi:hypothetical protein ABFX02_12G025000 [Erythranthe guttata]
MKMSDSTPVTSVRKGAWTKEEDFLLTKFVKKHGEGKWHQIPIKTGLKRCRKSCRLRWLNYLKPGRKRGPFSDDEIDLVLRLRNLLGNRWSLIAGRIPGRTANDVKNYWNTHLHKKLLLSISDDDDVADDDDDVAEELEGDDVAGGEGDKTLKKPEHYYEIVKPRPWSFSKMANSNNNIPTWSENNNNNIQTTENNNNNIEICEPKICSDKNIDPYDKAASLLKESPNGIAFQGIGEGSSWNMMTWQEEERSNFGYGNDNSAPDAALDGWSDLSDLQMGIWDFWT